MFVECHFSSIWNCSLLMWCSLQIELFFMIIDSQIPISYCQLFSYISIHSENILLVIRGMERICLSFLRGSEQILSINLFMSLSLIPLWVVTTCVQQKFERKVVLLFWLNYLYSLSIFPNAAFIRKVPLKIQMMSQNHQDFWSLLGWFRTCPACLFNGQFPWILPELVTDKSFSFPSCNRIEDVYRHKPGIGPPRIPERLSIS